MDRIRQKGPENLALYYPMAASMYHWRDVHEELELLLLYKALCLSIFSHAIKYYILRNIAVCINLKVQVGPFLSGWQPRRTLCSFESLPSHVIQINTTFYGTY